MNERDTRQLVAIAGLSAASIGAVVALGRKEFLNDHPIIAVLGITSIVSGSGYYIANLAVR